MSFIISQLLLLYRGEEGKYKLNLEKFNLNIIIEEIINEYKNIMDDKKIKIYFNSENEIIIKADQTLITRLFINLIDNSIKCNKENGIINVILSKIENKAKIVIEDNGIGISQKDLPYIFDRFYQVDKTSNIYSTSLGLSIVKWIVEVHKGTIKVESKLGLGTKFLIYLPLNLDV